MPTNSRRRLSAQLLQLDTPYDSQSLFSLIAEQPWAMWLDSCESTHIDSRYDIMVWQPSITLTTLGDTTSVKHMRDNSQYQSMKTHCYFAYDLGKRFEVIKQQTHKDIAIPEMAIGIYQHAVICDRKLQQYWLLCFDEHRASFIDFFNHALTKKSSQATVANDLNLETSTGATKNFKLTTPWQSNMPQAQYREKFQQVHDYLAQRFSAQYNGCEYQAYCALRAENKAPFSAFLRFDDSAILSISPERFLQKVGNKIQSKPIKGTRPRSQDPVTDQANANELRQASKDRAENLMIVDLLRNDISRVCVPGSVTVPALFAIESFPAVHHLVSTVEGEIAAQYDGSDLLRAAFPGGSITGAPKIRAMDIIEELEPNQRSVYCGSIGYLSACGNMDTSITIRTLVCHKEKIHCWAGGGLVADSNVDSEYQETYDKVNKILPVLSKLNATKISNS